MANTQTPARSLTVTPEEKAKLLAMSRAANAAMGELPKHDPPLTIQQIRERMVAEGVRPEENSASEELIRMRHCEMD